MLYNDNDVIDAANAAARFSGPYIDILHYLVEQAHLRVPDDALYRMKLDHVTDLNVLDYLVLHDADVNAFIFEGDTVLSKSPGLIRYWLDREFKVSDDVAMMEIVKVVSHEHNTHIAELLIDVMTPYI